MGRNSRPIVPDLEVFPPVVRYRFFGVVLLIVVVFAFVVSRGLFG
jgi:hypothetical protein